MKQWVLSVRTSLPGLCYSDEDLKSTLESYDSFDEAKQEFKNTIKRYAFEENEMFDGKGHLTNFDSYACDLNSKDEEKEIYDDCLYKEDYDALSDILVKVFEGQDVSLEQVSDYKTDWMIAVKKKEDIVAICGEGDGPINGYDPYIKMNCFNMSEEKEYFLYINDMFGVDVSSELYIDLKKIDK